MSEDPDVDDDRALAEPVIVTFVEAFHPLEVELEVALEAARTEYRYLPIIGLRG